MLTAAQYLKTYKPWSFLDLYQNGEKGAVFIPAQSRMFTTTGETTPSYNDGDAVSRVYDLTGRFLMSQGTGTAMPTLKVANGTKYLSYDGGDSLPMTSLSSVDWRNNCGAVTVAMAFRVPSTGSTQNLFYLADASGVNSAALAIQTSSSSGQIALSAKRANGDTVYTRSTLGADVRDTDTIVIMEADFMAGSIRYFGGPGALTTSVGTAMNGTPGVSDTLTPAACYPLGRNTGPLGNTARIYACVCISRLLTEGERRRVVREFQKIVGAVI